MLKKSLCIIMCFLTVLCLFTGCDSVKGADSTIYYPIDKDPQYLDPQIISYVGAKNIIANCFEGLVSLDENGEIVPAVAESYTVSPSGLVYTFKLRQDSKWRISTASAALMGKETKETLYETVTAHDFVFAFRRAVRPETKSPGAIYLYCIKNAQKILKGKASEKTLGVKAKDKFTLEITLEKADPDFLYTLLESVCMPCNEDFFEATKGRYGLSTKYLIYNGPFYISNWADDTAITLRKNENGYYDASLVMPRSVYYSINNEQNTRLNKIKDDIYTIAPLTKQQKQEIENKKKYTVHSFSNTVTAFVFNCKDASVSDVNIRRAIAASLDKQVLTSYLEELSANGVIPKSMTIGTTLYREIAGECEYYSGSKPQSLFNKGLKAIDSDDIEVTVLCKTEHEGAVRALMQSWQASLGINFNVFVEAVDEAELNNRVSSGNYQIALCDLYFTGNTAFSALNTFASTSGGNIANYSDKKYDSLVAAVKKSAGITTSAKNTKIAEQYLINSAVIIPLYEKESYYATTNKVSGVMFNKTGEILYFKKTLSE